MILLFIFDNLFKRDQLQLDRIENLLAGVQKLSNLY